MYLSNYFKKNWKNYLLLLCSILISLIALEIYFRIYVHIYEPLPLDLYEKDKDTLYKLKAGYNEKTIIGKHLFGESYNVKINSKGLRDYEYNYKKPDNTFRILVLGDSFAFGVGVDLHNTFPKVLEKKLNNGSTNIKYEVINAGVPAYCTYQELGFLKKEGLKYNPDMIILAFYHDDIYNNNPMYMSNPARRKYDVYSNYFIMRKADMIISKLKNPDYPWNIPLVDLRAFSRQFSKDDEGNWKLTERYLKKINNIAKRQNISFVLVTVPSWEQILLNYTFNLGKVTFQLSDRNQYYEIKPSDNQIVNLIDYIDFEKPNKLLQNFTKKENIKFIDLLPEFKKSKINLFLLPEDNHYNTEGYKLVADSIFNWLIEQNLIKR